jgi:hypothetical protein
MSKFIPGKEVLTKLGIRDFELFEYATGGLIQPYDLGRPKPPLSIPIKRFKLNDLEGRLKKLKKSLPNAPDEPIRWVKNPHSIGRPYNPVNPVPQRNKSQIKVELRVIKKKIRDLKKELSIVEGDSWRNYELPESNIEAKKVINYLVNSFFKTKDVEKLKKEHGLSQQEGSFIAGKSLIAINGIRDFELFRYVQKGLQPYNELGKLIFPPDIIEKQDSLRHFKDQLNQINRQSDPEWQKRELDSKKAERARRQMILDNQLISSGEGGPIITLPTDEELNKELVKERERSEVFRGIIEKEIEALEKELLKRKDFPWRDYSLPDRESDAKKILNDLVNSLYLKKEVLKINLLIKGPPQRTKTRAPDATQPVGGGHYAPEKLTLEDLKELPKKIPGCPRWIDWKWLMYRAELPELELRALIDERKLKAYKQDGSSYYPGFDYDRLEDLQFGLVDVLELEKQGFFHLEDSRDIDIQHYRELHQAWKKESDNKQLSKLGDKLLPSKEKKPVEQGETRPGTEITKESLAKEEITVPIISFFRESDYWRIGEKGKEQNLKHTKGLLYLHFLFKHEGDEISSVDVFNFGATLQPSDIGKEYSKMSKKKPKPGKKESLLEAEEGLTIIKQSSLESIIKINYDNDSMARIKSSKEMIRKEKIILENKRDELQEKLHTQIDNPELAVGTKEEFEKVEKDINLINRYLKDPSNFEGITSKQPSGKKDQIVGSQIDNARINVQKAIKTALKNIYGKITSLHQYLNKTTIKTGNYCSYNPDPNNPVSWKLYPNKLTS